MTGAKDQKRPVGVLADDGEPGDPRVVLLGRSDAGLMALGCRHRGHLADLWAGSTTQWLRMHPPAPILIARHGNPTQSVALCVDGSPHAQRALQAFWALPWSRDVVLGLVSVDHGNTDGEHSLTLSGVPGHERDGGR